MPAAAEPAHPSHYARFLAELNQEVAAAPIPSGSDEREPSGRIVPRPPISRPGPISDGEKQSIGCLVAGTVGMGVAMAADGVNVINVVAGGLVMPANQAVLYTSLVGVVFASFCAVGQALTPAVLMVYDHYFPEPLPETPPVRVRSPLHSALRVSISQVERP